MQKVYPGFVLFSLGLTYREVCSRSKCTPQYVYVYMCVCVRVWYETPPQATYIPDPPGGSVSLDSLPEAAASRAPVPADEPLRLRVLRQLTHTAPAVPSAPFLLCRVCHVHPITGCRCHFLFTAAQYSILWL